MIAEAFAHAPKLDPSGTSWLPAPFWLNGAAMMLFGRSLEVARVVSARSWASRRRGLFVLRGAKLIIRDPRRAAIAAAVATLIPWSVYLGVATVPQLPVAARSRFYALATLVAGRALRRSRSARSGASPLAAATPLAVRATWPIALGFAVVSLVDRCWHPPANPGAGSRRLASALAIVGPIAWMLLEPVHAHGDAVPLRGTRVAAFSRAAQSRSIAPLGYLVAACRHEHSGLTLALTFAFGWAALRRADVGEELRRWARPAALVACGLAALTIAGLGDAAPTHHPERVTLVAWLTSSIAAVAAVVSLGESLAHDRRSAALLALAALAASSFARSASRVRPAR